MNKAQRKFELYSRLQSLGFTYGEAVALRRIELTLSSWAERECGDGSNWAIERDEVTGKPFNVYHGEAKARRYPIADRESGALKRLKAICDARNERESWGATPAGVNNVVPFHQTDCRGCMVYLVRWSDLKTSENQIIAKARTYGAKIAFRDIANRVPSGCYVVEGMNGTPLFSETFNTEELAAEAFLKLKGLKVPYRDVLDIGSNYNRGLAVCA